MQQRTVILVGLALVIAFLLIMAVGRKEQNSLVSLPLTIPTGQSFRSRSFFTRRFTVEQVALRAGNSRDCLLENGRFTIAEKTSCTFSLQPSQRWTRELPLILEGNQGSINITLSQPNQLTVEETLNANQPPVDFAVFRRTDDQTATLTIFNCVGAAASKDKKASCVLRWES